MSYTQLPVALVTDDRLSYRAKGLIGEIASYAAEPEGTMPPLTDLGSDGRTAIARALDELERFGYLTREQTRRANGQMGGTVYRLAWGPVVVQGAAETHLSTAGRAYAMQPDGSEAVKIGCTNDLAARLRVVQTSHPATVRVIWQANGGRALEDYLHRVFAPYRLNGEWFDFTGRDAVGLISAAADEWAVNRE